jgi:hypothetical protein
LQLPGYQQVDAGNCDLVITRRLVTKIPKLAAHVVARKTAIGVQLVCPFGTIYEITKGQSITLSSLTNTNYTLEQLPIYGIAIAIVLHQRDLLVFHASCMDINGHGVMLIGDKGAGKSTLALCLLKMKHTILGDDVAAVDVGRNVPELLPGGVALKLWPKVMETFGVDPSRFERLHPATEKRYYVADEKEYCKKRVKLRGIILLAQSNDKSRLEEGSGNTRLVSLVAGHYLARYSGLLTTSEQRVVLEKCSVLIEKTLVYTLHINDREPAEFIYAANLINETFNTKFVNE